ncbi:hypothetical protein [Agromyces sp. S2-1-8]|uniref:hypothetical protein n=1 Tax=Agromyces sp. S2-1-8 TaxID=2897180 RepID=UPI001E5853DE|nr:hypothetical protein [Agromyces sp. S2-1-8]MCD5346217.1 hypothetical protein [Agromyces sp. S2-1-8]
MSFSARAAGLAGAAACAIVLAGCTGAPAAPPPTPTHLLAPPDGERIAGNGLWLLAGPDATHEIAEAISGAGAVQYHGSYTELTSPSDGSEPRAGRGLAVDYRGRAGEYAAKITAGDERVEVVAVDGRTYVRGNEAYASAHGIPDAADGFVCATGDDSLVAEWAPLLEPGDLVESLLASSESVSVEPPLGDADLIDVIVGQTGAPVGVLTVARSGAPLPREFRAADGTGDGTFAFEGWGEPIEIEPPAELSVACG